MRIEIAIYEGYDEVDAIGPFEVLRNAALAVEDLEVVLVGSDGPGEVVAGHGRSCQSSSIGLSLRGSVSSRNGKASCGFPG